MTFGNRNLVVAVRDQINGRRALQRALALARAATDSVHLVHAQRAGYLSRVAELLQPRWKDSNTREDQAGDEWLEDLAVEARAQGYLVRCSVVSGAPGAAVANYAREIGADLIVVASPREGLSRELFLGSTALSILRRATCPVLVARNDPTQPYRSALVAIDGKAMTKQVMAAAGAFFPEARIDLAHAYLVPEEHKLRMRGASEEAIADLRRDQRPDVERTLQPFADLLPRAVLNAEHGFPPAVILDLVNRIKPDVVVIGKHAGSALDEQVLGSVTQFLLYACNTDFLLVA